MPLRSYAFFPALAALAIEGATSVSIPSLTANGVAGALALGTGIAGTWWALHRSDGTSVRIPIGSTVIPPPDSSHLPSSVAATVTWGNVPGYTSVTGSTVAGVCATIAPLVQASYGDGRTETCVGVNETTGAFSINDNLGHVWSTAATKSVSCPAGYTVSGTTCNLTNARQAVDDGAQDFQRSGTSMSPYTGDKIGSTANPCSVSTTTASNDTVTCSGVNAAGHQTRVSFIAGGTVSGTFVVDEAIPATGTTPATVARSQVTTDANQITGVQSAVMPGSMGIDSNGQLSYVAPIAGSSSVTSSTSTIQFPTDYNREVTQGQIKSNLEATAPTLSTSQKNVGTLGLPSQATYAAPSTNWLNFLPGRVDCSPWLFSFGGRSGSLDLCPFIAWWGPLVDYSLIVMGIISGAQVWLRREDS